MFKQHSEVKFEDLEYRKANRKERDAFPTLSL